jgi:antitoxin component YwqK of YwqJK toxin-antitoxin module
MSVSGRRENGTIYAEYTMVDGELFGNCKTYHENDIIHGGYTSYNLDGRPCEEAYYENGERIGYYSVRGEDGTTPEELKSRKKPAMR